MILLRSIIFGFAVAAPVGPMSLLCMRRTLTDGWRQGLATGIGIALADGIYAAIAVFGLHGASVILASHARMLDVGGGIALLYLGWRFMVTPVSDEPIAAVRSTNPGLALSSAVLLTLSNPATIIIFFAISAGLTPPSGLNRTDAALVVGGVTLGSVMWWGLLVAAVTKFRTGVSGVARRRIGQIAGGLFIVFGLIALWHGLF